MFLLLLAGCKQELPSKKVTKYFLVTLRDYDPSSVASVDIFMVDNPDAVRQIGRWGQEHVNNDPRARRARGIVTVASWHTELLRFDERERVVSSDDLFGDPVISSSDLVTLKELFQKHGRRVDTVPGRKPPRREGNSQEKLSIEFDKDWDKIWGEYMQGM